MSDLYCPVAYDHDEDFGRCEVCGWDLAEELAVKGRAQKEREGFYQEHPWLRPPGAFAPSKRIVICDNRKDVA